MKGKELSRRDFIKLLAMTGGAAVLSACGVPTPTTPAVPQIGGELKYLGWEGYDAIDPDAFPTMVRWLEENGITVSSTYIGNNEETFTKLQAGGPGAYDLTTPYIGVMQAWIDADLIEPLDLTRLTNYTDVYEQFARVDLAMRDDRVYAIPFTWAPAAQLYNADVIPEPPASWMDLLDPRYTGRVVTIDGNDGFFTTMAKIKGFGHPDPHSVTMEELEQMKELGRQFLAQVVTIAPSYGELSNILISGDADITMAEWAAVAGWAQAEGVNILTNIPREGSLTYIDGYSIPKGAVNLDTAYAFIDMILSPEVQAELAVYLTQGVVNRNAVPLLPPEASFLDYNDLARILERAPAYPPVPNESDEYATYADWLEAWEELKAGM